MPSPGKREVTSNGFVMPNALGDEFDDKNNWLLLDQMISGNAPNSIRILTADAIGPKSTGYNDTALVAEFIDDMWSDAMAAGRQLQIAFPTNQVYEGEGWFLRSNLDIDFNGSEFIKTANDSGTIATSNTLAVFRTGPWDGSDGSWYGQADNITIRNATFNANNKNHQAVLELHGVRNFRAHNITTISSQWAFSWQVRGGGRNAKFFNCRILGGSRLYQDGFHWQYGDGECIGCYVEAGDDVYALGNEAITANVYHDDEPLEHFRLIGCTGLGIRGAMLKVYRQVTAAYAGSPNNYVNTRYVRGIDAQLSGKSGLLRNGGVTVLDHRAAGSRVAGDLKDIRIHADLEVGTDGKSVWSAVSGTLVGNPTAVTQATPPVVSLTGHGLSAGEVIVFQPDVGGMTGLNGFYQVMASGLAANTFAVGDTAYRNTQPLFGTNLTAWTTGKLLRAKSGSGYAVGQDLTLSGGTFTRAAVFRVTQVDVNGAVEAIRLIDGGKYSTLPSTPNSPTGGTGTGAQLWLELVHDGVNAYGSHMVNAQDVKLTGRMLINDTTGSATRFMSYDHDDSSVDMEVDFPMVPAKGGSVGNSSGEQFAQNNRISGHMTCNGAFINASTSPVMLSNAEATLVEDLIIDNLPANAAAVAFPINGNTLQNRPLLAITGSSNSTFTAALVGLRAGMIVRISGNVLSSGSLDGYYIVRQVYDSASFALKALPSGSTPGANVGLGAATVTTLGNIEVANNTVTFRRVRVTPATNASGTTGVTAAASSPHRVSSVIIDNCDFSGMSIPVGTNVPLAPAGYVFRDTKV